MGSCFKTVHVWQVVYCNYSQPHGPVVIKWMFLGKRPAAHVLGFLSVTFFKMVDGAFAEKFR